jgi:hypothetical protein
VTADRLHVAAKDRDDIDIYKGEGISKGHGDLARRSWRADSDYGDQINVGSSADNLTQRWKTPKETGSKSTR